MFFGTSYLEWSAVIMTATCIFLAGRNNIHTWWVGIVACMLFGALFYSVQLYADVTLQVFFVVTGLVGWYGWAASRKADMYAEAKCIPLAPMPLPISQVNGTSLSIMIAVAVVTAAIYGSILYHYTEAYAPGVDSLVLTFSVLGQLLLMRRKIETWPVWIFVNTMAVPLFYSRELYLTAGVYAIFWLHGWWAWYNWRRLMNPSVPKNNKIWNS